MGLWKPNGKEPYQDKHEPGYDEPYTPGESDRWLKAHMDDVANKPDTPTKAEGTSHA